MADIRNTQAKRLYKSLLNYTDEQNAEKIVGSMKLSANPGDNKKIEWAQAVCAGLDKSFDDETVKNIRMGCHCKPSKDHINKFKSLYRSSEDLSDFAEKLNDLKHGASFWYENDSFYMSYPVCYCSFVNKTGELLPKSWCYCTLGYTKYMFDYIFERDINVELLESVKMGNSRCVIKINRD